MLENIKIRNFRNFTNYEVTFNQGVTTLFGRNGVGKSSLIEAIYFLSIVMLLLKVIPLIN